MSTKHNKLVSDILDYLAKTGVLATDTDASRYGRGAGKRAKVRKGWSDVTACLHPEGKFLAIEVKIDTDKLNPDQMEIRDQVISKGGIFIEARDLDDVIDGIKNYRESLKINKEKDLKVYS